MQAIEEGSTCLEYLGKVISSHMTGTIVPLLHSWQALALSSENLAWLSHLMHLFVKRRATREYFRPFSSVPSISVILGSNRALREQSLTGSGIQVERCHTLIAGLFTLNFVEQFAQPGAGFV
jgi:hypothetical protein